MKRYSQLTLGGLMLVSSALLIAQTEFNARWPAGRSPSPLFQVSTLDALTLGLYEDFYSIGTLKQQGDF